METTYTPIFGDDDGISVGGGKMAMHCAVHHPAHVEIDVHWITPNNNIAFLVLY